MINSLPDRKLAARPTDGPSTRTHRGRFGATSCLRRDGSKRDPQGLRSAFTLLEVLLTLSILVAVTAIAVANLRGGFRVQRLKKGADQVRTAWAQARVDAIKTGRVHVFHHTVQGNKFFVAPQASYDDPIPSMNQTAPSNNSFAQQAPSGAGPVGNAPLGASGNGAIGLGAGGNLYGTVSIKQVELPRDISFLGADVRLDQRSSLQMSQAPAPEELAAFTQPADSDDFEFEPQYQVQWGMPIYFFPDGTSSSAQLVLDNGREQVVTVYLRGLTGLARVGTVDSAATMSSPMQGGALR